MDSKKPISGAEDEKKKKGGFFPKFPISEKRRRKFDEKLRKLAGVLINDFGRAELIM